MSLKLLVEVCITRYIRRSIRYFNFLKFFITAFLSVSPWRRHVIKIFY